MVGLSLLQFGIPAGPEVLIILAIIVLLFGANKIPQLAGALGEARAEFERGRDEVEEELTEMQESNDQSGSEASESSASGETGTVEHNPPEVNERDTEVEGNTEVESNQ